MNPLDRLLGIREKRERLVVGLMSGMSIDGLDLALVRLADDGPRRDVTLVASKTAPYPAALSARVRSATRGTTRAVCTLHVELADRWARDVLDFLEEAGVDARDVDALGSHGQTLDHVPRGGRGVPSTLQIGDGDVLAERTGILTVSDFRARDIAAGGEGAPLVPLADWLLHARPREIVACQNLGSIANVTVVTERAEDVIAFDTGPANALIDAFARRAAGSGEGIDRDGELSSRGRIDVEALARLYTESAAFLHRPPPRSAGFDEFGEALADRIAAARRAADANDLVRTAVEFTARTLAEAYEQFVLPRYPSLGSVHVTGGGTRNPTLMARIRARLELLGLEVVVPEGQWVDAKEAVAFALLADETLHGRPGNLPGATGADRGVVLGKISL